MLNLALVVRLLECVWGLVSFAGGFLGRGLCTSCLFNGVEVLEIWSSEGVRLLLVGLESSTGACGCWR